MSFEEEDSEEMLYKKGRETGIRKWEGLEESSERVVSRHQDRRERRTLSGSTTGESHKT
jgi:hypothetical protein